MTCAFLQQSILVSHKSDLRISTTEKHMRVFRVKDIQPRKPTISSSVLIRYRFSLSTVVNRALLCFHGGLLEITLTTLVSFDFFCIFQTSFSWCLRWFGRVWILCWRFQTSILGCLCWFGRVWILCWRLANFWKSYRRLGTCVFEVDHQLIDCNQLICEN